MLVLVLVACFAAALLLRRAGRLGERGARIALGSLAALALGLHLVGIRSDAHTGRLHIHYSDVYHYFIGTKYFPELGYTRLYEATVVADSEDDPGFRGDTAIRSLRTNRFGGSRAQVLARAAEIKAGFSPERWREFKSDLAVFREAMPDRWQASRPQQDHGYNGTPLTTAILGALARLPFPGAESLLLALVWLDLALLLITLPVVARGLGWETAFAYLFFWCVNPFNGYAYVGGGLLRYAYFFALVLGTVALQRGRQVASGFCFALASLLRVFPIFLPLALLAADALRADRRAALRRHRPFYLSLAASGLLLVAVTLPVRGPDGTTAWLSFAERIGVHNAAPGPNFLSLRYPFLYAEEHNTRRVEASWREGREPIEWSQAAARTFEQRRAGYWAVLLVLGAALLARLRRADEGEALFIGLCAVFGLLSVSHYYYCTLALVPLFFPGRRDVWLLLAAAVAAYVLTRPAMGPLRRIQDLRFLIYSLETLALFAGILWLCARRSRA